MSDFGRHPFVDPSQGHSYEGVPPNMFANPNDFAHEHEWFGANEAIRIQMDRAAWGATQFTGPSYVEPTPEVTTDPDEPITDLLELADGMIHQDTLGNRASIDDAEEALRRLQIEHLMGVRRGFIIEFCSWWHVKMAIQVMEDVGINKPIDNPIYAVWYDVTNRIEDRQAVYDEIPDANVRKRMRLTALQGEMSNRLLKDLLKIHERNY